MVAWSLVLCYPRRRYIMGLNPVLVNSKTKKLICTAFMQSTLHLGVKLQYWCARNQDNCISGLIYRTAGYYFC